MFWLKKTKKKKIFKVNVTWSRKVKIKRFLHPRKALQQDILFGGPILKSQRKKDFKY